MVYVMVLLIMDWLKRLFERKYGVPMRNSQDLHTHLNRRRDFAGNIENILRATSSGR